MEESFPISLHAPPCPPPPPTLTPALHHPPACRTAGTSCTPPRAAAEAAHRRHAVPPGFVSGRKRGRPPGSQSAKSMMEQKMALVKQRLALLDSASSRSSSSSAEIDKDDDDFVPMDDELVNVAAHQPIEIDYGFGIKGIGECEKKASGQNISASYGSAMDSAEEVQAKLPAEHPSFVKVCQLTFATEDTGIILEDENGQDHQTLYLGAKQGLSAGWRGFAIKHDIKVGAVVIFQLVGSMKFKVYIIKQMNLQQLMENQSAEFGSAQEREAIKEAEKASPVDDKVPQSDDSNAVVSEAIDGLRISDSDMDFGDVTRFSNFNIVVYSLVIDCKFHDHLRRTYYELCCSQKSFLHKNLLKQLNLTLVVGVIMETISIAEGIRACKAQASSCEDLVIWKKTLESFELMGMNVAFLLKRINNLLGLPAGPRDLLECQKYKELKSERAHAGEKVKGLELTLSNVKGVLQKMDAEMEGMESSVKRSGITLQQLATAPW
ncbi:B3 domain-containing protein [Panicum miliaceum]|uniref:B3 domain-containing protein n=1 Tax=Panicum miliaceum TaxID=4540 RepID=A0A3L6SR49_PANMI|nr:B3 domain-containing protein [Panicum miliaceum]